MPRLRFLLIPVLILGELFTAEPVDAQARRLQSRALFARLDSTAVADSAAMLPLNPGDPADSLMLALVSFLDGRTGLGSRASPSRIRYWDIYRTQAHPALGILVDRTELRELFDSLRSLKRMMGIPRATIQQRVSYVALFLVAHEYGHLQQYRRFGIPAVAAPDSTRVVECGADLLGAMGYRDFLDSLGGSTAWPREALAAAVDFGHVVGSSDWLDGTAHPLPEHRRKCIETGILVAAALDDLRAVRAGSTDSAKSASARFLKENEPGLYAGSSDLVDWSQLRARGIVSQQSVVDGTAVFEVVRDPSAIQTVRRLAAAALKGSKELRKLRAGPAPEGNALGYLLRDALPTPWKCTIGDRGGSETASCEYQTIGYPDSDFREVVDLVSEALAGTNWKEAEGESQAAEVTEEDGVMGMEDLSDIKVVFAPRGSDPDNARSARIEISRHVPGGLAMMTQAELIVDFSIGLLIRARR